ncbi:multidrug resistance protein A [Formosimonas limnophila]|uniref:Multidrug resistance protein A n=1 Tax=Formosimonas limnophila TaxID=1384487 RepID=A0A8J3CH65_9BURK|nr:efflux RND transporter periplasmic adaptor subunit [Formosimonas limnophila]GHA71615.1 multidrug resistance protein A [Formosimonas limnophila]
MTAQTETSVITEIETEKDAANASNKRKKMLIAASVFLILGIAWVLYYFFIARFEEKTDNAYVGGSIVAVNAQTSGTVEAVLAEENQEVKAGQELVKLTPTDADVALAQASAQLADAARQIKLAFNNTSITSAQLKQAQIAVKTAQDAVNRRAPLVATGAVSKEELATAKDNLARAQAALQVAKSQNNTAAAQVSGTDVANHPTVERAKAAFREAYINHKRLAVVAPMDGIVAKRFVQVGQSVAPNLPLMNLVAANQVWVDANFKETQLANLRVGQDVELKADMYGNAVTYKGKVQGIAIGTGSAFSVLPAQNATGNWIKIVQRVPVRILIDAEQLKQFPLRVGMSIEAVVDTHNRDGAVLGSVNGSAAPANLQTTVYTQDDAAAEEAAMAIINANQ